MDYERLKEILEESTTLQEEQDALEFLGSWLRFFKGMSARGECLIEVSGNAPETWQRASLLPARELSPESEEKLWNVEQRLVEVRSELSELYKQLDSCLEDHPGLSGMVEEEVKFHTELPKESAEENEHWEEVAGNQQAMTDFLNCGYTEEEALQTIDDIDAMSEE